MIEIISAFVLIIIVFIGLFWLKKTLFIFGFFFKIFMLLLLIGVIGSVLFGYMLYKDANDFKDNFANGTNLFIVKDTVNGTTTFLSGVAVNGLDKSYTPLPKSNLSAIYNLYKDGKLSDPGLQYYKIFVIDLKAFDSVKSFNISDQNIDLDSSEIREVMLSDSARDKIAEITALKNNESKNVVLSELKLSDEEIKAYILSYYLASSLDPKNLLGFISQLKDGNIEVYPETMLFKAIKYIPSSIVDMAVKF